MAPCAHCRECCEWTRELGRFATDADLSSSRSSPFCLPTTPTSTRPLMSMLRSRFARTMMVSWRALLCELTTGYKKKVKRLVRRSAEEAYD